MRVSDLFRRLSYGELSNLSLSEGNGLLKTEKHPQIIQYANEGLIKLYSRFPLKEKSLILVQNQHVINYHLLKDYAVTSNSNTVRDRYILDSPLQPFQGDVLRIVAVQNEEGEFLPLNDRENPKSLYTPMPTTLQIGAPVDGSKVAVTYQASHAKLSDRKGVLMGQDIILPFFLENALQNYIGYKAFSHMNGQENIVKGQEYLAAYEAACLDVEQRDLVNQSTHTSHDKLEQRGFV